VVTKTVFFVKNVQGFSEKLFSFKLLKKMLRKKKKGTRNVESTPIQRNKEKNLKALQHSVCQAHIETILKIFFRLKKLLCFKVKPYSNRRI